MLASELIKELQKHIDKNGDMPVFISDKEEFMGDPYEYECFSVYDAEKKCKFFNNEWHDNFKYLVIEPW